MVVYLRVGLCSLFKSPWGGGETHVKMLSTLLTNSGYSVSHFSAFDKHPQSKGGLFRGIFKLSRKPYLENLIYDLEIIYNTLRLNSFTLYNRVNLLHLHYVNLIPCAYFLRRLTRIPIVATIHWCPLEYPPEFASELWHTRFFSNHQAQLFTNGLGNITKIISPSKYIADIIKRRCDINSVIIPNTICIEEFQSLPGKEETRKALGIKADNHLILTTGRLVPQKGLNFLIEAIQYITQKDPLAKLIVVGAGPSKEMLVNLMKELGLKNVTFLGYVRRALFRKLLAVADIYVSPTLYETFGVGVLEALASGLPIVTTNICSLPEIVEDGINGFLVPPKDPYSLSEAVLRLLNNDSLRARIREKNLKKARKYSTDVIFPQILEVYEEAIIR